MNSFLYPLHTKGTRVKVIGKSEYFGQEGVITIDPTSNYQSYFNVKIDNGNPVMLHAESLQII